MRPNCPDPVRRWQPTFVNVARVRKRREVEVRKREVGKSGQIWTVVQI